MTLTQAERHRRWRERRREGIRLMKDVELNPSPLAWDGRTAYSTGGPPIRHQATCFSCARTVDASEPEQWRRACVSLRCEVCGSRLLFEEVVETVRGGAVDPSEVVRPRSRHLRPVPTRVRAG